MQSGCEQRSRTLPPQPGQLDCVSDTEIWQWRHVAYCGEIGGAGFFKGGVDIIILRVTALKICSGVVWTILHFPEVQEHTFYTTSPSLACVLEIIPTQVRCTLDVIKSNGVSRRTKLYSVRRFATRVSFCNPCVVLQPT